jgi:hypothetical protein
MRLGMLRTLLCFGIFSLYPADGMFLQDQLQKVPLDRVFTNLQHRLIQNTNDFELTYYLARLHSMAYATNLPTVNVRTNDELPRFYFPGWDSGVPRSVQASTTPEARKVASAHLTNAIALYQRTLVLRRASTNASSKTWMILPTQLGLAWCLDQAGRTNDALNMYRRTLKVAWKCEVTGDFDLKEWLNDVWRDVKSHQNPIRTHNRGHIGPDVCYSQEIIGYMLRLLDPVKDANEIAELKKDQTTLSTMPLWMSPILIPLVPSAGFNDLVDEHSRVPFDLDGSGLKRNWAWLTPKAGWLVYDPQRTGRIDSGLQMFGNVTFWIFWPDGYEALSSLDDNGDGVLSGVELRGLAVWNDWNCDGVSDPGEVIPVEALGIESIYCRSQTDPAGMHWNPQGVTFTNGVSRPTFDWIVPSGGVAP